MTDVTDEEFIKTALENGVDLPVFQKVVYSNHNYVSKIIELDKDHRALTIGKTEEMRLKDETNAREYYNSIKKINKK